MQKAGSRKQEAINIQTVRLVLFCYLILEWDFINFHQDCRVHVKISCTLCYSCTKTRNQYRHVQKFCSGSYYMHTGIWNHWTEFCMLVHTIWKQVLFLGNSRNERGNWFTPKTHACSVKMSKWDLESLNGNTHEVKTSGSSHPGSSFLNDITLLSRCREHLILQERRKLNLLTRKMRLSAALFLFSSWDQGLIEQSGRNAKLETSTLESMIASWNLSYAGCASCRYR